MATQAAQGQPRKYFDGQQHALNLTSTGNLKLQRQCGKRHLICPWVKDVFVETDNIWPKILLLEHASWESDFGTFFLRLCVYDHHTTNQQFCQRGSEHWITVTDHSNTGMTFEIVDMLVTSAERLLGQDACLCLSVCFTEVFYTTCQIYPFLNQARACSIWLI